MQDWSTHKILFTHKNIFSHFTGFCFDRSCMTKYGSKAAKGKRISAEQWFAGSRNIVSYAEEDPELPSCSSNYTGIGSSNILGCN